MEAYRNAGHVLRYLLRLQGRVRNMPDSTKLKKAIDFHQQVSFKEGILETIKEAKKENI